MNLEERLRRTLTDDRLALPGWPDAAGRIRRGMVRRRRRRLAAAGAAVAVVATIVGVSVVLAPRGESRTTGPQPSATPSAQVSPGPGVIPWLDAPAEPPPAPTGDSGARPTARPCTAADLSTKATLGQRDGATGHLAHPVTLTNVSTSRCTLSGSASVIATNEKTGHRGTVKTQNPTFFDGPDELPATIDPGEAATLYLATSLSCYGGINSTVYKDVRIVVLGRTYPLAGLTLDTTCPLQVGNWHRIPTPPPPVDHYPGLAVTIEASATAHPGQDFHYVVVLHNSTTTPITLDPCPVYRQMLWKSTTTDRLNCAITEIGPGESLRFAMQLTVASYAPTGPTTLRWEILQANSDQMTDATANVTVS